MSYPLSDRDGFSRAPNGQYGLMPSSSSLGGSGVTSPAENSPEITHKRHHFQTVNSASYFGENSKLQKHQVRYFECQRNHAASIGGHAVDGCGEFLPGGKEGTLEAFKCAACLCHRNFHRREYVGGDGPCICRGVHGKPLPPKSLRSMSPVLRDTKGQFLPSTAEMPPYPQVVTPLLKYHEEEDDDDDEPPENPRSSSSKTKRFRTKFTPDQKQKMLDFAEMLGWRIEKQDELLVQEFCDNVNVKRKVFKVWMHNNKNGGRKLGGTSDRGGYCESPSEY